LHPPTNIISWCFGPRTRPHPTHRLMISSCFDHQHPKNISWIWLVIPYIYIHNRSTIIKLVIKHKSHNSYVKTTKNISKRNSTPEGTCFFFSSLCPHVFAVGLPPLEDEFLFGRGNDDGRTSRRQHRRPGMTMLCWSKVHLIWDL
jgi:hypothetical protein